MDRRGHDGRMDPTGSGQNLGNDDLSFPLIKKRSKFRRQPPKRFVDTEREIEITRPTTQSTVERLQGPSPSASHSVHLPSLTGNGIVSRDCSSPVRLTASSPNPTNNHLILPPIEPVRRVPTPRPPQTPNNRQGQGQGNFRARFNYHEGRATSGTTQAHPPQSHPINVLNLEYTSPPPDHNARTNSRTRTYTAFSREANSASRNANSASRNNTSRLGGNASRISNLPGSTSAKNRDDAPNQSSKQTSAGQPTPATYQHQASSSDGALMIKGIKKPSPTPGGVCNSNDLRRHSTGGKMVPKLEKTNQGLVAIDEKPFLVPKPLDKPKSRPTGSQKRPKKPSLKSPRRSSKHPSKTSQADDNYEPDFHPESDEAKTAHNSRASSSKASSRPTSSKASSQAPSSKAASRPPSSIPEEIEGRRGRYDYSDEVFETYEDPEAGSRSVSEVSSIPEELPGQSRPYNYQDDDDVALETDISEEIVTSDDHDDEDYTSPTSRC